MDIVKTLIIRFVAPLLYEVHFLQFSRISHDFAGHWNVNIITSKAAKFVAFADLSFEGGFSFRFCHTRVQSRFCLFRKEENKFSRRTEKHVMGSCQWTHSHKSSWRQVISMSLNAFPELTNVIISDRQYGNLSNVKNKLTSIFKPSSVQFEPYRRKVNKTLFTVRYIFSRTSKKLGNFIFLVYF